MPGPVVRTERPRELELASVFDFKSAIKPSRQCDFKTPVDSEKKGGQICEFDHLFIRENPLT